MTTPPVAETAPFRRDGIGSGVASGSWRGWARILPLSPWPWGVLRLAMRTAALITALITTLFATGALAQDPVNVGSKRFTESYLLAEMVRQTLETGGIPAEHRQGLGNTAIVAQALRSGRIDLYPEYTGTILREILGRSETEATLPQLNDWLAPLGLKVAVPLGFNNTYALALRADRARALGLVRLSDLAALPPSTQQTLKAGFSPEFLNRSDGWPTLRRVYGLTVSPGQGLDHGLAYAALARGDIDLMDAYSTDAAIDRLGLVLLQDDRQAFPRYDAVLLMRADLDETPLRGLAGRFDESTMAALNRRAESGVPFETVAREALAARPRPASAATAGFWDRLLAPDLPRLVVEHLLLVVSSTGAALVVGLPLGLWAQRRPRAAGAILGAVGVLQTIPSLALLAVLIAALGRIGTPPALVALFLYALLPIVQATQVGLAEVAPRLRQAGLALGLRPSQVLRHIEWPLARPVILSGVGSSAVIGVGTATVAAFVGAGGLGERIVAGLAVNDTNLMLAGAVPAALMALLVQAGFARWSRPRSGAPGSTPPTPPAAAPPRVH